jgi:hypothetical protein
MLIICVDVPPACICLPQFDERMRNSPPVLVAYVTVYDDTLAQRLA